jgi:hypothetical protein
MLRITIEHRCSLVCPPLLSQLFRNCRKSSRNPVRHFGVLVNENQVFALVLSVVDQSRSSVSLASRASPVKRQNATNGACRGYRALLTGRIAGQAPGVNKSPSLDGPYRISSASTTNICILVCCTQHSPLACRPTLHRHPSLDKIHPKEWAERRPKLAVSSSPLQRSRVWASSALYDSALLRDI